MIVFDIETIPTDRAMAEPYPEGERTPPANYKSEEAIAKWVAADREKWDAERVKDYSLNARTGRVVAIGMEEVGGVDVVLARTEAEEAALLRNFWDAVMEHHQIAGFNSHGFDFSFLLTRSLILGVAPRVKVPDYLRRYTYTPHFDVRMALTGWDMRASGTLDAWCAAFGITGKSGNGSEVYGMVQRSEWDTLSGYCRSDVVATAELVARVAPTFGVRHG